MLSIGTTGLIATQGALSTTSHNISNVNTEGYNRQRAEFGTYPANFEGGYYIGSGVQITTVERMFDQFLSDQVRRYTSQEQELNTFNAFAGQIDDMLGSPELSISAGLDEFFNAVQDVADDPTSLPARQVMLTQASILTNRFHLLDEQMSGFSNQINTSLEISVDDINVISDGIAKLNQAIFEASFGGTIPPNDLMDQRDQLINELAEYVSVSTLKQDDGSISVFVGNGQALVVGNTAIELSIIPNPVDPSQYEIAYGPNKIQVSDQITGGSLGGLLTVRTGIISTVKQELDALAVGVVDAINAQHQTGISLTGSAGGDFFSVPTPPTPITAQNINVAITDPRDIAIAFPVVNKTAITNTGTGQLEINAVDGAAPLFDPTNTLTADISFIYDSAAGGYNVTYGAASSFIAYNPLTDSGKAVDLSTLVAAPLTITLTGKPENTDNFTISNSVDAFGNFTAVGDNRNGLAMGELQVSKTMDPNLTGTNTHSFGDSYGIMLANVAARTHQASVNQKTQQGLLDQANLRYETVSGVNLDEEAANLIKFQQAYQAAAQIITTSNTVFNALINAI